MVAGKTAVLGKIIHARTQCAEQGRAAVDFKTYGFFETVKPRYKRSKFYFYGAVGTERGTHAYVKALYICNLFVIV